MVWCIFIRDVKLAFWQNNIAVLGFFLIVILCFVLSGDGLLQPIIFNLIWSAMLLAHLLLIGFFFEEDYTNGILELMIIEIELTSLIVITKSFALWVALSLPLVLTIAAISVLFEISLALLLPLIISTAIGSLGLVFFSAMAGALTCGLLQARWLAPLIILPLELPILIFGASCAQKTLSELWQSPDFMILIGLVLLALALSPIVAAKVLTVK